MSLHAAVTMTENDGVRPQRSFTSLPTTHQPRQAARRGGGLPQPRRERRHIRPGPL